MHLQRQPVETQYSAEWKHLVQFSATVEGRRRDCLHGKLHLTEIIFFIAEVRSGHPQPEAGRAGCRLNYLLAMLQDVTYSYS